MRIKTSVSLPEVIVTTLDAWRDEHTTRSDLIEEALSQYIARRQRAEQYEREIAIINQHADKWNTEMEDILSYQEW